MKKYSIFLILFITLLFTGCPGGEDEGGNSEGENKSGSENKIDMKSAKEFMDNYMRYVIKMDTDVMKSFYTPKLKEQIKDVAKASNPHPVGYSIGGGEGKEKKAEYTVSIFNAYTGSPYFSSDTYKYTVVMEDGKMLIDSISKDKVMELFGKGKVLFMKEGSKVEGKYVISLDELPTYASPQSSPEVKLPIPRDAFGPCALSPDNKSIIFTSVGKDSFIAMGELEEEDKSTMNQRAEGGDKNKQGGDKKGGGEQGGQEKGKEQEQQKAKIKMNPIDLYPDTKINVLVLSPDGKTLAVETAPVGGQSQLKLYKSDKGEGLEAQKIKNNFRPDRFSLSNPYFTSPTAIVFTVKAIDGAQDEEKELEGEWIYDIKAETLKQSK